MNFKFKKPPGDVQDLNVIPNHDAYHESKKHISQFGLALDIGAHVGTMSRLMANDFKLVHSFEPLFYEYTLANTEDLKNVTVHNCGLGNVKSKENMYVMEEKTGGSSLIKHPRRKWQLNAKTREINIKPLDSFSFDQPINFIKIDVESYEYYVVDGAKKTLTEHSPVIMIEYLPKYQPPIYNSDAAHKILESLGYRRVAKSGHDNIYCKENM
jgi:FkbM family methyltransferase